MSVLLEARDVCMYFGGLKAVESVNRRYFWNHWTEWCRKNHFL